MTPVRLALIATAAAVRKAGRLNSAADAAAALKPVAGSFASHLFGIGLFGASALAGAVVPLSTSYAISEAVGVERSVSRRFREAPLFLGLFTAQVVIGSAVALLTSNLVQLLIITQVLNGLITPVILAFILVMANRRSLLGDAANGPVFRVTLLRLRETEHILLLVMHHIACDGWSNGVLARELGALYSAFGAGKPSR